MSRLHRQKLRALARAGETPANRPNEISPTARPLQEQLTPMAIVKPSRAKRPRRKAVLKSKTKAKAVRKSKAKAKRR